MEKCGGAVCRNCNVRSVLDVRILEQDIARKCTGSVDGGDRRQVDVRNGCSKDMSLNEAGTAGACSIRSDTLATTMVYTAVPDHRVHRRRTSRVDPYAVATI